MKNTILLLLSCFLLVTSLKAHHLDAIPPVKKITIFWDTSLSMKDKDLLKELTFLDNYFYNIPNVEVDLITFSNQIDTHKSFTVNNSNWALLRKTLENIKYDGVAYFNVLQNKQLSDINFLFTDGVEIIDKLILNKTAPTYVVNSSKKANFTVLIEQSYATKGRYINLAKATIKEALSLLNINSIKVVNKKINKVVKERSAVSKVVVNDVVSGVVYSPDGVLEGATVTVNGGLKGVVTNDKGEFKIKAILGDILEISYVGKRTNEVLIDSYEHLEVLLLSDENELDEVVVNGASKEEQLDVGYGKTKKKKLGYAVQSIDSDKLNKSATDVSMATRGKFSGVTRQGQNDDLSQMILRANSILLNVYPLIVIDGTPIARSNSAAGGRNELTNFIDPNNIAKISILKGLAATNRWGSQGSNGIILITTKTALSGEKTNNSYDKALLRDNNFTEDLALVTTAINEKYIEEFKGLKTLKKVYNYYLKQRLNYLDNPLYFVNVSDYIAQWGDEELASKILSNIVEINPGTITILKLVAYKAEERQHFLFAKQIYEKIAKLKPNEAQSYRDLALIYQETGNYQEALNIYKNIQNKSYLGVYFSGVQKNIDNEMKRLLIKHKNELNLEGIAAHYLSIKNMDYDARIVFDWNDRTADFKLQFVNPQNKFFTWPHTKLDNEMRLNEEKTQGFNTEEFLLIDAEKGEWQINIESKIKQREKPVVIKYTVYKNYGKPNEIKESKLLILNNIKGKKMAGKIVI